MSVVKGERAPVALDKRMLPCSVCGSVHQEVLYPEELGAELPSVNYDFSPHTRKTFQIVKCNCGMIFVNPMPRLGAAYSDNIDDIYLASSRQRKKTAEYAVSQLRKYASQGTLLDVGCATGFFLDAAAKYFSVEGVELSAWAADISSQKHRVYREPLSSLRLGKQYDVLTMWGVIEHLEEPAAELQAAYNALKPGGLFALYTGDVESWMARLLGKKWWWFQGMHLLYYSRRTLEQALKNAGFEPLAHGLYRQYFELSSLSRSFNRYPIGKLLSPILNSKVLADRMVPLDLSGEMVVYARKAG